MAEIELVIKIDENKLWSLKNEPIKENFNIYELASYIDKGIPLPKGHGDLIDRRELKEDVMYIIKDLTGTFHNVIHESSVNDAQTIIKANTEIKEDKKMKLIIDIPEEEYEKIKACTSPMVWTEYLIKNGTPLPKGHGRLIDADALEIGPRFNENGDLYGHIYYITEYELNNAPTIIEADDRK